MTQFHLRQTAQSSPTKCAFCGSFKGPFIDTGVELPVYGTILICTHTDARSGCARQIARLDGMFDPDEKAQMADEIMELEELVQKQASIIKGKRVPIGQLLEAISE